MKKKRKGKNANAAAARRESAPPASASPVSSEQAVASQAPASAAATAAVAPAAAPVAAAPVAAVPAPAEVVPAEAAPAEAAPASASPVSQAAPASAAPDSGVSSSASPPSSTGGPRSSSKKKTKKKKAKGERISALPATAREGKGSVEPAINAKLEQLEAKLEERREEAERAARKGFGSDPALDEESIPPVVELDDHFFAAGDQPPAPADRVSGSGTSGAFDAIHSREARKMTPEAHARRAHLSRYVMMAVGACVLLLVIGVVVKKVRGRPNEQPVRAEIVHAAMPAPPPEAKPEVNSAGTTAAAATDQAKAEEAKADDTAKADEAKAGDTAKTDEAKADTAKTDEAPAASASAAEEKPKPTKTAWQEKATAKAALEGGANGMAIAAGERSVALDPSDAEAWLILGAAYQAKGNMVQAHRCYNACVTQGRRGPKDECREMLRQ